MAQQMVALPVTELQPSQFMFSPKQTKSWDFLDKSKNKRMTGSHDFVELWYKEQGEKLAFVLENVKTTSGIQTTDRFNRGFMSINLEPAVSALVRKHVDDIVFAMVFQHREDLLKNGRKINQLAEIKFLYKGVVQDGKEKVDKDTKVAIKGQDGKPAYWSDSITGDIAFKKGKNGPVVDENVCQIVDLNDRPYAWSSLSGKVLREVVVEVDKVVFGADSKIKVHCTYRCIVPNEVGSGGAKYTTKRRLEAAAQEPAEGGGGGGGGGGDPPAAGAAAASASAGAAPAPAASGAPEKKLKTGP